MYCRVCKQNKPKEDFYYYNPYTCKKCVVMRSTKWIKENPSRYKAVIARWQKNHREVMNKNGQTLRKNRRELLHEIKQELGGKCMICGYDKSLYPLQFHHVDPDTKEFTMMNAETRMSIKKIADELRKCVLLCRNCHIEIQYS